MSFLARSFAPLRVSSRTIRTPTAFFSTSTTRSVLSENDRAQDQPNRESNIDRHKHDSVNRAKEGKGEWKPELASSSEQAAAADKDGMSMDEMQKMGEKKAEQGQQPSGSSSNKV